MKVTPIASPALVQDMSTPDSVRTAKAVAAFNKGASSYDQPTQNDLPVPNANSVSPEDLSAIVPQTIEKTEETQVNTAPEETSTAEEKPLDPELKRRFDQIARQERQLRAKAQQQAQQLKAREESLKARESALEAQGKAPDLTQYVPKERLLQDALAVLEENGITYDQLTERVISRQPIDPTVKSTMEELRQEIKALKQANETNQKSYQEQQTANYKAAVKQITNDARSLINSDPEFETVKAMNATKDVVELIEQTYAKDGVVLTVEEAAKEVEAYLIEEALKITQIDKIKKRMAAANASQLKSEVKPQSQQQPQMKTLTNATSSTRPLTARERAIAAAEGRLKS